MLLVLLFDFFFLNLFLDFFSLYKNFSLSMFSILSILTEKPYKFENIFSPDIRFTEASSLATSTNATSSNTNGSSILPASSISSSSSAASASKSSSDAKQQLSSMQANLLSTPQNMPKLMQTPSTITNSNANKQLRYEDSPSSLMINQTCDLAMLKYVLACFFLI